MIIYKATNKFNGKIYIGITTRNLDERISDHIYRSSVGSKYLFHKALRKYGIQSFSIHIIDTAKTKETLIKKEISWINRLNTKAPSGYNLTNGGDGIVGWIRSEQWKRKISKTMTGRKRPMQSAKMMGKNNPMFGKTHSETTKQWMSENNPTKRPEVRMKLKQPKSEEHKRKLSEANKDKHPTEETRRKLSESHKGKCCGPKSEATKEKMRKNHADVRGAKNPMYGKRFFGKDNPNYGNRWKRAVND